MIFVSLPVKDLAAATRFYEGIGCRKNPQFSDDNTSSMMWSDKIVFMLLTHSNFATFTSKPIADSHATAAMLIALSRESREDVDTLVEAAWGAGGAVDVREPMDMGFMYNRAIADPDGHVIELVWMNPEAMAG
jgi:predicted lactoylglutathione lyase